MTIFTVLVHLICVETAIRAQMQSKELNIDIVNFAQNTLSNNVMLFWTPSSRINATRKIVPIQTKSSQFHLSSH